MGAFLGFKARRFTSTAGANDRGGGGTQEHAPLTLDKATEASWTITGQRMGTFRSVLPSIALCVIGEQASEQKPE